MNNMVPIVSKLHCSPSQTVLGVRRRPHVVNGGGFVVTDCSTQKVVFKVHGCGIHGKKEELILRDGDEEPLLLMRRKGGMVEVLSISKKWRGYSVDYEGLQKQVFSLKEPGSSCLVKNKGIRISIENGTVGNKGWDFEIRGYFPDKNCSIVDTRGNIVAQVGVNKEVEKLMESKDLYHVVVKPGIDQAFVFGVIATLDSIYGESTYC